MTGAYRLKIDKKTGAISVSDRKGRVIIEKVVFLTSADPLCTDLGEVINAKYKDMKVPNNGTIIGDDIYCLKRDRRPGGNRRLQEYQYPFNLAERR